MAFPSTFGTALAATSSASIAFWIKMKSSDTWEPLIDLHADSSKSVGSHHHRQTDGPPMQAGRTQPSHIPEGLQLPADRCGAM